MNMCLSMCQALTRHQPEKLVKDKSFMTLLHRLSSAGKLARIVIDEAHCVSSYGHDFRPDYKNLHILKNSFPSVPIMALSATCPPKVLQDLISILRLPPVTPGEGQYQHASLPHSPVM
jgi:ATP-dependent DNA helicase Q1